MNASDRPDTVAPLLEMAGITKRFPGVVALSNVSVSVGRGEIVALIGENGAGKSTLMKILGGVYVPDEGTIQIDGRPAVIRSVGDALKLGIGFIHQELNVLPNLDVAANVFLGREPVRGGPLRLVDQNKIHADAQVFLDRLGLDVPSRTLLGNLSLARQQMVEIAKALSQNARILIMDEPTSSLTLKETDRLLEVTRELRAQGVSVIYISHRLNEIMQIADRVVGLRDGANAGSLAKAEITHDAMVKMMVGRDLERLFGRAAAGQHDVPPPPAGAPFFEVRNLQTRRYPGRTISFSVNRGEILGIAGLVGAGRSEVAQAVCGVDTRRGGEFLLNGAPLPIRSPRDAIRQGVYLVPEDRRNTGLLTDMTIRENITLPALKRYSTLGGLINFGRERQVSQENANRLNVKAPTVETRARNLSGGNQQKVVLAKWLSLEPKVLFFDEPTRGIDVGAKAEIYDLMRKLAEEGVAIVMISSDMEEVLGVSDRVAVMHEGQIIGTLDRGGMNEENVMRLAVGGGAKKAAQGA